MRSSCKCPTLLGLDKELMLINWPNVNAKRKKRTVSYHGNSGSARILNMCPCLLSFAALWSLTVNPWFHRES